jgi:hypothetical protein
MEDDMSEIEMKDEIETEEFTDELSDEALDREQDGGGKMPSILPSRGTVVPVTDR